MKAKLSMAFEDLRGKDGNVVITRKRSGLTLTPHTTPRNPKTESQVSSRRAMTLASKTFESMTVAQVEAWDAYGATLVRTNPVSGKTYTSTGIAAFIELATKFLQMSPNGTIPLTPPSSDFLGDTITLTAGSETPGEIQFDASGGNAAGVTTELLVQRLPNEHRDPNPNAYKHAAFFTFVASTGQSTTIDVPAGFYAAAYRFVRTATGQATDLVYLPVQTVALSVAKGGQSGAPQKAASSQGLKKAA